MDYVTACEGLDFFLEDNSATQPWVQFIVENDIICKVPCHLDRLGSIRILQRGLHNLKMCLADPNVIQCADNLQGASECGGMIAPLMVGHPVLWMVSSGHLKQDSLHIFYQHLKHLSTSRGAFSGKLLFTNVCCASGSGILTSS